MNFQLLHNFTHLKNQQQSNAQNSPCESPKYVNCWIQNRQRNQKSNCQHPLDHIESKEIQKGKKISFCFIDYAKVFDCVDHKKLWKILKEMGIPDHLTCLLRNLYAGQEATVRTLHGTKDCSELGMEYVKAAYCHSAYLTSMQSTSCEMPGWMKYKVELRLLREISITSDTQVISHLWQKLRKN